MLSRLVYRKGMDLLLDVIPSVCALFPQVHWIIGGDGPKRGVLEEMREKYQLQERVEMIGAVAHSDVRNVLTRGHLFLNCSLTEAFCIAILEAVSCGLYVVSTRVGGVPEILPPDVMSFASPTSHDIVLSLSQAIPHVTRLLRQNNREYATEVHGMVRRMYNWHDVARRTERVYERAVREHQASEQGEDDCDISPSSTNLTVRSSKTAGSTSLHASPPTIAPDPGSFFSLSLSRLSSFSACGPFVGLLFSLVVILDHLWWRVLEWMSEREQIDVAVEVDVVGLHSGWNDVEGEQESDSEPSRPADC